MNDPVIVGGQPLPTDTQPWTGSRKGGLRVYLDGGIGDAIQCFRYARWLTNRGAIIVARPQLLRLFQENHHRTIWTHHPIPGAFWHVRSVDILRLARMSRLPRVRATAYLRAPEPLPRSGRIGLCSRGNPQAAFDRRRSIYDDRALRPLLDMDMDWIDLTARRGDWTETANVVASLDAVVSVDTGVAHLAGALGVPLYLMERAPAADDGPDKRWEDDRLQDGPLYLGVRRYRQRTSWQDVTERIAQDLAARFHLTGGTKCLS